MIRNSEKSEEYAPSFAIELSKSSLSCKITRSYFSEGHIEYNRVVFSHPREDPSHERKRVRVGLSRAGGTRVSNDSQH